MMKRTILSVLVFICIYVTPALVVAGDFDGSQPLICALIETYECAAGEGCQQGLAGDIGIPQFLKLDFKGKKISGTMENGESRTASIESMTRVDGNLVLQGFQNGRAWSMVINESTGKCIIGASDDQAGFIVFGACTTL
jgi:hypothetical protein